MLPAGQLDVLMLTMSTNTTSFAQAAGRVGWQSQPNGRGTIDIIWSCLFTLFLCVWTVLSLNVPARGTSPFAFTRCKMKWMVVAALGPEWVTGIAGGQWSIAHRSAKQFRSLGYEWTTTHAYFADMGGLRLKLKDDEFPITSDMLLGLLKKNAVQFPEITQSMIEDRSKIDLIAKLVTILQTAWFGVQCIARLKLGLGITSLELSTLAFVVCTIGTTILWWSKPRDVMVPIVISENLYLADLIGKETSWSWQCSPLEKLDALRPSLSADILPLVQTMMFWKKQFASHEQKQEEGKARFRNDRLPPEERDWYVTVFLTIVSVLFGAVYVAGWNIDFPTLVESICWRVAICGMLGLVSAFWALDFGMVLYYAVQDIPMQPMTPFRIAVCGVIATVYVCCRLYLIIEMFVSLRALPVTAYETINWTGLIPHLN